MNDWILAAVLGMVGQALRASVGLFKATMDKQPIDIHRLWATMLVGALAGVLSMLSLQLVTMAPYVMLRPIDMLAIVAAGYAGTDFIESFITRLGSR